jgi:hypothetical protein
VLLEIDRIRLAEAAAAGAAASLSRLCRRAGLPLGRLLGGRLFSIYRDGRQQRADEGQPGPLSDHH